MDVANYALASYLARAGENIHLVAYRVADELAAYANVTVHLVPKPAGAYTLGAPLLALAGLYHFRRLSRANARVVANGGNCPIRGINWVHYLHAAYTPPASGGLRMIRQHATHRIALITERTALSRARIIIANSDRTRQDIIDLVGVPAERVHRIYYGTNAELFRPPTAAERATVRASMGFKDGPRIAFIGALSDRRKGFDVVFEAWRILCADRTWDAHLVVVGSGSELPVWQRLAREQGLDNRIEFLGFRKDVPTVLKACDALVAPAQYEAYGLGVHEALCCGLPALVSHHSGVAERYPEGLRKLLLRDPGSPAAVAESLRAWRRNAESLRAEVGSFSEALRSRSWDDMAQEIATVAG